MDDVAVVVAAHRALDAHQAVLGGGHHHAAMGEGGGGEGGEGE